MKKAISVVLISVGAMLCLNALILAVMVNFNAGILITLAVGAALGLWGIFYEKIRLITQRGFWKWVKRFALLCFAFMLLVIAMIAGWGQLDTADYHEDALIVLGAGIRGERVTMPLAYRLHKAVEYYQRNPQVVIVVSGGQGPQEAITEALAMERYLVERGVPQEAIFKEEQATSTYENFVFSKKILDDRLHMPYRTVFVTNDFHVYRASRLAAIAGLDSARIHAKIEWYTIPLNYLREFTAVLKLWVLRR